MSKTKFKQYYEKMVSENKHIFDKFTQLHFEYSIDQEKLQKKFNLEGKRMQEIIREYENRLCANTERGIYNKFSTNLAEKFQNEVRKHFPLIDHIGVKTKSPIAKKAAFSLKKIKLT
jgi:hypothetical protein